MNADTPLRVSPLHASHLELGAKMVPFGGWEMPLAYPSGTVTEHRTCRTSAVAFDVSHLGTVRVRGADAFEHLQHSLSNDLTRIHPGRAQYTHLLDEDGFVVDDIIVWWIDDERFDVMPNASNTTDVIKAIGGIDVTDERAVIAIQGPEARSRLEQMSRGGRDGPSVRREALRVGRCHVPRGRDWVHGRGGRGMCGPGGGGARFLGGGLGSGRCPGGSGGT